MENSKHDPSDRRPVPQRSFGWIQAIAASLAKSGISPNTVSVAGLIAAILAGWLWATTASSPELARPFWLLGVFLVLIRILANTLDGMVAIEWGRATKVGLLYNDVPDRLSDSALLIGMGYAQGGSAIWGFAAVGVAIFVTYTRLIGRSAGAPSDFCGPMDKGGRMIVLVFAALLMGFAPVAWVTAFTATVGPPATVALMVICAGGIYTAARRLIRAARFLEKAQ